MTQRDVLYERLARAADKLPDQFLFHLMLFAEGKAAQAERVEMMGSGRYREALNHPQQ